MSWFRFISNQQWLPWERIDRLTSICHHQEQGQPLHWGKTTLRKNQQTKTNDYIELYQGKKQPVATRKRLISKDNGTIWVSLYTKAKFAAAVALLFVQRGFRYSLKKFHDILDIVTSRSYVIRLMFRNNYERTKWVRRRLFPNMFFQEKISETPNILPDERECRRLCPNMFFPGRRNPHRE